MENENVKKMVEEFDGLSEDEKKLFCDKLRRKWPMFDFERYKDPVTTKENMKELQEMMVQLCIDYINENSLTDIDEIQFSVDQLQFSSKYGEWTPQTDSYICSFGYDTETKGISGRKIIEEYY